MSTYLQGITDFIPDYQPFQPDLNFYANALQTKQTQYDSNWKAVNNLYGQLHGAELTHDQNIAKKDQLLKQIDFNLKRVSGLDLSLEQNVQQATQVFRPFYEDKYLMKDMAWTKNFSSTYSSALALKSSQDQKMREQYWDTGIKEMQYRRDEFKEATLDETLNMGSVQYTPYSNAMKKYEELAKSFGDIETKTVDESGLYFIRQKNGALLIPSLQSLFMSNYATDPELQKIYATQAYVDRKDYSLQNATKYGGDKNIAEKAYLKEQYAFLKNYSAKRATVDAEHVDVTNSNIKSVNQAVQEGDVNPKQESYLENLERAMGINTANKEHSEKINNELNGDSSNTIITKGGPQGDELDLNDIELARLKVDAGRAAYFAEQDILGAANLYANRNSAYEMSANPIGLENLNHQHAMSRADQQHKYKLEELGTKAAYDQETNRIKHGIATGTLVYNEKGVAIPNEIYHKDIPWIAKWISGMTAEEINVEADNAEKIQESKTGLTNDWISNWFANMSQLVDKNSPEITDQELWGMMTLYDYNEKGAFGKSILDKAGVPYKQKANGKAKFLKLQQEYAANPEKVIKELTNSNMVLHMKKGFESWASKHDGHKIVQDYYSNENQKDASLSIEHFVRYQDDMNAVQELNTKTISKSINKAFDSKFGNFNDQQKAYLSDLFLRGVQGGTHEDLTHGMEGLTKEAFVKLAMKKYGNANLSYKKEWTDPEGAYYEGNPDRSLPVMLGLVQGSTEKQEAVFEQLYDQMSNNYFKTVTTTGPEGLKSAAGYLRGTDGRYALSTKAVTTQVVNLAAPGTPGFQSFMETMGDLNRINFNNDPSKYKISYGGATLSSDAADQTEAKQLVNSLLDTVRNGTKTAPFRIGSAQIGMENKNLGTMVIIPTKEWLEKHVKITDGDDKGKPDYAKIKEISENGITFTAPRQEWSNTLFQGNRMTPTEQKIAMGGKINYKDPNGAGSYSINKVTNMPGVDYALNYSIRQMDDNGKPVEDKYFVNYNRKGNKIDMAEKEMYNAILMTTQSNLEKFREFHRNGNTEALNNAKKYFGYTPQMSGFSYVNLNN